MEKTVPKKLIFVIAAVFLLFALSFSLFIYFLGEGAFGGIFQQSKIDFSLLADGLPLYEENKAATLPEGEHSFSLKNRENEAIHISLYTAGELLYEALLAPGDEAEAVLDVRFGPITTVLKGKKTATAYIADSESFAPAISQLEDGGDLIFYGNVSLPASTLTAPFRLFGFFSFEELSFDTALSGNIVLMPSTAFSGKLYVSAPGGKVYFRNFTLDAPSHSADFYIKAKSLDGERLLSDSFPVSDFGELKRLADPSLLPKLSDGANISFLASFDVTESLNFQNPVTLDFVKGLSFGDHTLSFSSDSSGTFRVKAEIGTGPDAASLHFNAPDCALLWESLGAVPALSTIEKYNNLLSYNGDAVTLGGKGSASPEVVFTAADNAFLQEDVTFSPEGNLLVGTLPFQVSRSDLDSAVFSIRCEGGQARLEGNISSGRIIATDEKGQEKRFALAVNREKKNIPVIYLETENGAEITSKSQYVSATFTLDGEGTEIPSQTETHIRIRGRGNSTWKWEKKPYKIHFDEATSILGLPAAEEWALFANYADKSLMRNRLAQVMASELSFSYCPTQEYVDLFLNGEYLGVYTVGEHLEAGAGRVEVDYNMTQVDCGYFLEAGGVVSGVDVKGMNYFHAGLVKFVLIKSPEYNTLTSEQFDYIKEYMLAANSAVKAGEGYEEYINMETLVDWLIMIELTNNTDCAWRRSTYFTKDPGGKLEMGPVWDFDLAFGNFSKDVEGFNVWVSSSDDDYVGETWSTHLLEDPEFQKMFKARWEEVKEKLLETAMNEIDEGYELLYPSAEENFERWDILGKKVAFERHDTKYYKTYSSQVVYLKDFLEDRAAWIDQQVSAW